MTCKLFAKSLKYRMDPMSTVCGMSSLLLHKQSETFAEVRENSFPQTRAVERKKCDLHIVPFNLLSGCDWQEFSYINQDIQESFSEKCD